jgi:polyisoprenoid-binding protein YceI
MHRFILLILIVTLVATPGAAQQLDLVFDPARTVIEFTLDATLHKVHGTFDLVSGNVRYDSATGEVSGAIVIDARSGDTGNDKRDRDMHSKVLESDSHPTIELIPELVVGDFPAAGNGNVQVVGSFRVGGREHPVEIPLDLSVTGAEVEIRGQFDVPYVAWGLEDPSKFVLRVAKEVAVAITAHATVTPATAAEAD